MRYQRFFQSVSSLGLTLSLVACGSAPSLPGLAGSGTSSTSPAGRGDTINNTTYHVDAKVAVDVNGNVYLPGATPTPAPTVQPTTLPTAQPTVLATPVPEPSRPVEQPTPDPRIGVEQVLVMDGRLSSGGAWTPCVSSAAYQATFDNHKLQNLYPVNTRGSVQNGQLCFQAVMAPLPGNLLSGQYRHGLSYDRFQAENQLLQSQGYQLMLQQVVTGPDLQEYYQGIWYQWTPESTPVSTPEPTAMPTPVPTPQRTPEPTPLPMPEPTPFVMPQWSLRVTQVDDKVVGYVNKAQVFEAKWGHGGINEQAQYMGHIPGDSLPVALNPYLLPGQDNFIRLDLENKAECCGTAARVEIYKDGVYVASDPFYREDSTAGIKMHWLIRIDANGNLGQFQSFYSNVLPPEF